MATQSLDLTALDGVTPESVLGEQGIALEVRRERMKSLRHYATSATP